MVETVVTYDGWYSLHDFRTFDWEKWQQVSKEKRTEALDQIHTLINEWQLIEDEEKGSHALYSIVGQKADFMFMILRPTMKDLNRWENEFNKTAFAHFTEPSYSYVSIIEK